MRVTFLCGGVFRALLREALDYDAMVLLCDSCRRMNMEKMRKCLVTQIMRICFRLCLNVSDGQDMCMHLRQAGFSDEAVEKFQKLFRALDSEPSL